MTIATFNSMTPTLNSKLVLRDWFERKERELRAVNWRFDRRSHKARWAPIDTPMEEWISLCREAEASLIEVYQLNNELGSLYDILTDSGHRCRMYIRWGEREPMSDEEIREEIHSWIEKRTTPGWDPFGEEY